MAKGKKLILIIAIGLIFLIIFFTWFFGWGTKREGDPENKLVLTPTPTVAKIEITKEEEPEIELAINSDRSGAALIITEISDKFDQLEYELIYLAESDDLEIERGVAGGPLKIGSSRKIREDLLFGTESCTTGTCRRKIDKNVSGGTLVVNLITPENQVWTIEKSFEISKAASGGYETVWKE
ncbi:MAG: hypothetical protein ABH867_03990 [Patescibacteria group bacterium]|nr:hypothetical protein [Patescibacteria group bacterium]